MHSRRTLYGFGCYYLQIGSEEIIPMIPSERSVYDIQGDTKKSLGIQHSGTLTDFVEIIISP